MEDEKRLSQLSERNYLAKNFKGNEKVVPLSKSDLGSYLTGFLLYFCTQHWTLYFKTFKCL